MPRGGKSIHPTDLKGVLENYTVPNLKKLAQLLEKGLPTRKALLVDLVLRHLEDEGRLRQLWAELDVLQKAAVSEVVHSPDDAFDAAGFQAKYGLPPDFGSRRWQDIEKATLLCLFIHQNYMPRDLKTRLRAFVPPPREAEIKTLDAPPPTVEESVYDPEKKKMVPVDVPVEVREMELVAQHDLHAILRLIDVGKVGVSAKTYRVSAAGARALDAVLQGGDFYDPESEMDNWRRDKMGPVRAFAWPLIVQAAGLVVPVEHERAFRRGLRDLGYGLPLKT